MEFKRYGRSYQMVIHNGNDLADVLNLDEALWGALSAPANVFACDPKFLELLDADKEHKITTQDVRLAIKWLLEQLPDHASILPDFDGNLKLDSINADTTTGKALRASAEWVLNELKASDQSCITLAQIRTFLTTVAKRDLNGDGVLTLKASQNPEITSNPQVAQITADVVAATGGAQDIDGTMGLNDKTMTDFLAAVPQYLNWLNQGEIPAGQTTTPIMPFGSDTPALNALLLSNAAKVDQFFQLSSLLDFDGRLQAHSVTTDAKVAAFDPASKQDVDAYQNALPLCAPRADCLLPLDATAISPAWRSWFTDFLAKIVRPICGTEKTSLTAADWGSIKATFAPFQAYMASKKGQIVEKLPVERLKSYLDVAELTKEVQRLIAIDKSVADTISAAKEVERLLLYRANLLPLVNNFVNFSQLYDPAQHALFECGKLVIDGRWFHIAFKVDSPAAHQAMGKASMLFLIYVEVDMAPAPKMTVVMPVTSGNKGNLVVGKRGVFYDNAGVHHDAKIVQIQENPVCIREALLAPIAKLWGIVEGKITEWSGNAEKNLQGNFTKAITPQAAPAAPAAPVAKPAKTDKGQLFMGIGVGAAAIGSSLAFISKTLSGMTGLQIWGSVLCAILVLMLPVSLIAYIKLCRQDLSALLEGCGWGINLRLRLDTQLRNQFTSFGRYPKDAKGTPRSHCLRTFLLIILIIAAIWGGTKYYQACKAQKETEQVETQNATDAAKPEADAAKPAEAK